MQIAKTNLAVAMTLLAVVTAGCTLATGDLTTETRSVSGFREVVLMTSGNIEIEVTGTESLEIEAQEDVLPLLTSEVVDGRLELGTSGSFTSTRPITYTIKAAEMTGVVVRGSGNVDVAGIDATSFRAEVRGSGNIDPAGRCDALEVTIGGSGNYEGDDLESITGTVMVSGSGNAVVDVSDRLEVNISGSGNVRYIGDPALTQEITGSGGVSPR